MLSLWTKTINVKTSIEPEQKGKVKMKNQKKPLIIRPSRTLKTTSKNNFCFKSLSTMGASTWLLCVTFYVYLCKNFEKSHEKTQEHNHVLAPIVGKDLGQKFILGILLGVLEGLISRGLF